MVPTAAVPAEAMNPATVVTEEVDAVAAATESANGPLRLEKAEGMQTRVGLRSALTARMKPSWPQVIPLFLDCRIRRRKVQDRNGRLG